MPSVYLQILVQLEKAKAHELKDSLYKKLSKISGRKNNHDLAVEHFKMINNWYHYPIIEMTFLKDFDFNAKNISKRLKISILEAEVAIDRLMRMELIERDESGKMKKVASHILTESEQTDIGLREFHSQMLAKAQLAVNEQKNDRKFVGSETFPFDLENLKKAKELINTCFDQVLALSKDSKDLINVYHLGIQLFSLTNEEGKNETN